MRFVRVILFLLLLSGTASVSAKKKSGGMQKVYVFGFASSFSDSLAYISDVQVLDSAYILPNGFLADRGLYSLQFYGYVNEQRGMENPTAAVFFDVKAQKLAKRYEKVKRMYQKDPNISLVVLGKGDFRFKCEEYMEELVVETPTEEQEAVKPEVQSAPDKKKGKKQKKGDKK